MTEIQPVRYGKYLLLDKIAVGGMAELYRAKILGDQGFEKLIVIKKVLPHLTAEESLVEAFIDEAKLAALLQHDNIIQIYDFGKTEGSYYISMEYLFGKDLRAIMSNSLKKNIPLHIELIVYIVSRICHGLDYSHNLRDLKGRPLNIIHRDISPQNILITYEGQVKIVDYGIAKAASQSSITQVGIIKGKAAYMSPEQAMGKIIDHRSDIFSTGILLYEMLTGRRMFEGETMQVLTKVREVDFIPAENHVPELPPKLNEILSRSLQKKPSDRYQTAGDMAAELEECLFEMKLRPNPRTLSEYMKTLFKNEFAADERAMRRVAQIDVSAEAPSASGTSTGAAPPAAGDAFEQTVFMERTTGTGTSEAAPASSPRTIRYAAYLLVLGFCFFFWFFFVREDDMITRSVSNVIRKNEKKEPATVKKTVPVEKKKTEPASPSLRDEAMTALAENRCETAVGLFERLMLRDPSTRSEVVESYRKATRCWADAIVAEAKMTRKDEPDRSRMLLMKAVLLDPENMEANFQLGSMYMKEGEFPSAIEAYLKVAEADPDFPDAFFNLGYAFAKIKDYPRSEEMYTRVVELKPDFLDEAHFNLALVQELMGKREESIENLKAALRINPDNEMAMRYLQKLMKMKGASG